MAASSQPGNKKQQRIEYSRRHITVGNKEKKESATTIGNENKKRYKERKK